MRPPLCRSGSRSTALADGEQHGRVFQGIESVADGGHDEQVAGRSLPAVGACVQAHPPVQDVHGGVAGAVVLVEAVARGQRDQGLVQDVLVTAEHGVCAAPAGGDPGQLQLPSAESGQGGLHRHDGLPVGRHRRGHRGPGRRDQGSPPALPRTAARRSERGRRALPGDGTSGAPSGHDPPRDEGTPRTADAAGGGAGRAHPDLAVDRVVHGLPDLVGLGAADGPARRDRGGDRRGGVPGVRRQRLPLPAHGGGGVPR